MEDLPLLSLIQPGAVHDDIINEIPLKIEASRWSKYTLWREESSGIFAEIVPEGFFGICYLFVNEMFKVGSPSVKFKFE
jgi:hypothetical protein